MVGGDANHGGMEKDKTKPPDDKNEPINASFEEIIKLSVSPKVIAENMAKKKKRKKKPEN